ncbi:MAG TPA: hypothetical protein VGG82_07755 [Casimicrobiaceae bacterium]|jgi:hypothetical protein
MDIGKIERTIIIEPVTQPVPSKAPAPAKEPVKVPEREKTPARAGVYTLEDRPSEHLGSSWL